MTIIPLLQPASALLSDPSVSRFSTTGAPVSERIKLWEEYNEEELFGLRCSTLSDRSIMATQTNVELDHLRLTHIYGNEHVIERNVSSIRDHPVDSVMLCLLLKGNAFLYHRNGCDTLSAGDAVVYDANRPFMYGFATDMEQVIVEVPRVLLTQRPGTEDDFAPQVLRLDDSPAASQARLAAGSVLRAFHQGLGTSPDTEESLLDAFHLLTGHQERAGSRAYLKLAFAFVDSRLGEELTVERLAKEIGLSARHLTRLFAEEGTTPARYITERRMNRAANLLADPTHRHLSIAQIGTRVGMRQPAHFSRAFKATFGVTPREHRSGSA